MKLKNGIKIRDAPSPAIPKSVDTLSVIKK